ncbi:hypothetical protein GCM10025876_22990 [Demequina litorisediminis]|uniref:Uncharacterized protein n=1 Tax=Demequina litorisediminis TaxID=1849022 RepID=A0ABQ6IEA4_9MICO|nr:hypothetical protein GCM10025876_22990 [Demequina litorisediminis]
MTATPEKAAAVDTVSLTIDGKEVSVAKGTLIIRAAEQVGIDIPRFCDHPALKPAGACRQCLVDVASPGPDGNLRAFPKPQPSCAMTVSEGMVVNTQHTSEAADKAQKGVMELLLINHPLDCPVCDKGGECPLQNQALSNGRVESRFIDVKRVFEKPLALSSRSSSTVSAASCASAARVSRRRSRATPSSTCRTAVRCSRSVPSTRRCWSSTATSPSASRPRTSPARRSPHTSPATRCRSAPWAR